MIDTTGGHEQGLLFDFERIGQGWYPALLNKSIK